MDTALMMLLEYKRRSKQVRRGERADDLWCGPLLRTPLLRPRPALSRPSFLRTNPTMLRTQPSLPIAGTLASDDESDESGDELSVGQAANNIVAFPVLVPAQALPGPAGAPIDMDAPLPVYEDRGGPVDAAPGPQGGETGQPNSAPGPAPHSLNAPQGGAPPSLLPHAPPSQAPPTLASRPLGANWWDTAPGPGEQDNQGGPSPPQPVPVVAGTPPGPAFTDVHHEIVAFAHRASPSQVRRKGGAEKGVGTGLQDQKARA